MELKVIQLDETLTHLALSGKLDLAGEQKVGSDFRDLVETRKNNVVVDMSEVTYLASLGIRLLFAGAKLLASEGKKLVVVNPQPMVEETLKTSGTVGLIPIAKNVDDALKLL